jgi:hypothetical protein
LSFDQSAFVGSQCVQSMPPTPCLLAGRRLGGDHVSVRERAGEARVCGALSRHRLEPSGAPAAASLAGEE